MYLHNNLFKIAHHRSSIYSVHRHMSSSLCACANLLMKFAPQALNIGT